MKKRKIIATLAFVLAMVAVMIFALAISAGAEDCSIWKGIRWGDASGDSAVNAVDVTVLAQYLANFDEGTGASSFDVPLSADANGDGSINIADLSILANYLANFDDLTGRSSIYLGPPNLEHQFVGGECSRCSTEDPDWTYSRGLQFSGSAVTGIGTCTDTVLRIPPVLPNGTAVTSIGYKAFYGCFSIKSVTIPEGVKNIGYSAFDWCRSLKDITLPSSVTFVDVSAFCRCSSLVSITVAQGNTIYHSAGNCLIETASKTLVEGSNASVIPSDGSVTSIRESAFQGRASLKSIKIPEGVTEIGKCAFQYCYDLTSVKMPDSLTEIGYAAFNNCSSLVNITIPFGVTSIGKSAFSGCCALVSVTIEDGVTSIGERAFEECSELAAITLPDSISEIGEYAFYTSDKYLNKITFLGKKAKWDAIRKGENWCRTSKWTTHLTVDCTDGSVSY